MHTGQHQHTIKSKKPEQRHHQNPAINPLPAKDTPHHRYQHPSRPQEGTTTKYPLDSPHYHHLHRPPRGHYHQSYPPLPSLPPPQLTPTGHHHPSPWSATLIPWIAHILQPSPERTQQPVAEAQPRTIQHQILGTRKQGYQPQPPRDSMLPEDWATMSQQQRKNWRVRHKK